MSKHQIILKQVANRNTAHVYEHMLARFLDQNLRKTGFWLDIDYEFTPYAIGNILVFPFFTDNPKVIQKIKELLKGHQPSIRDVKWAAQEISNEYFRPYQANFDKLLTKIKQAHNTPWTKWQTLEITKPVHKNAAQFRSSEINFLRRNPKLFEIHQVQSDAKGVALELRPLAAYVVYYFSINASLRINRYGVNGHPTYCDGYEWSLVYFSDPNDIVGRRLFFTFKKGTVGATDIAQLIKTERQKILDSDFIQRLSEKLRNFNIRTCRFEEDETFQYSGFIVGSKYFKKFATTENIESIINKIEFTVELEK